MKKKKLKKALKKLSKMLDENSFNIITEIDILAMEESIKEKLKEQPLTDANGEELVIGRLYQYKIIKYYMYYCGLGNNNAPIFELVNDKGINGLSLPKDYKSIASNTYYGYIGFNKEVEIAALEKDQYYYVEEGDFWMIGKVCIGNNGDNNDERLRGDYYYAINSEEEFNKNKSWCYSNTNRTFRKATEKEIKWLERCNEKGKYISKEEALREYKIGDWIITKDYCRQYDGIPLRINNIYEIPNGDMHCNFNTSSANFGISRITRLATPKEIKQQLIKEANERGFVEGFQLCNIKGHYYDGEITPLDWEYDPELDELTNLSATIYENGVWSEIKESYEFKVGDFVYNISNEFTSMTPKVTIIVEITETRIYTKDYYGKSWNTISNFNKKYRLATDKEIRKYCDFTNQP